MSITNMYQLENLVLGLLEALNDKNADVQESVSESLSSLGNKKADFVLKSSFHFVSKNLSKLTELHKVSIFNTTEKVVKENIACLEESIALQWIEVASNEMIQNKDKEQPILLQTASSDLLVAIGRKYVKEVFAQLQKNFVPGQLPHLFVLKTMANLAEINPFGVVPNLSTILASMLPMIGMSKLDSYKCAFASAMCKFSEAIIFYCLNKEKSPDETIEKSSFSTQIYAAHEIFFNIWIKTSDTKLRQLVIESIGQFVSLMPREKLEVDLIKIFPGLIALYKRHSDHFIVTQSLYFTISTVVTCDPPILGLEPIFDTLIKEMFTQVLVSVDQQFNKNATAANLSTNIKNQNELLRCFAELGKRYSDKMVPFLVQKFEQKDEKTRTSSLIVLKHLINSCDEEMKNKRQLVISGLRLLLSETSNRVKKNLLQVIIAMAYHDYLSLEGGNSMIEFILKQSTLQESDTSDKKQLLPDDSTNEQLKSSADSILTLFSTTVENMHSILWPHMLEYLTLNDYSRSISQLCKNLGHIAETKRTSNAEDFLIEFEQLINLPKPFEILTRLIVLCGVPLANKNRGLNVLNLMKNISPNITPVIVELWDNVVPKLIINLEDKITNSKFNQKNWEDLIMKLLSNTMDQIADEDKICDIAKSFGSQIETLYVNSVDEKYFAFKCLGIALNKTTSKTTIDRQLDIMFTTVNHNSQTEREGFAISFGYCGSVHLDTVLLKLENFAKNESKKSSGGLFSGILGSSKQADPDLVKATLVLAYGQVTNFAHKDLIISRLETYILRNVGGYASGVIKAVELKQNILKSIDLITKCMHQDHLQKDFNFSYKTTLLNQIIAYISSDNSKLILNDIKSQCFKVCANIVKLNPKPTEADMYQLLKSSTDSFFGLQVPPDDKKTLEATNPDADAMIAATNEINLMHGNQNYETTAKALEELLQSILNRDLTNEGLMFIFKYLEPWITSGNEHERLRSIRCLANILKHFANQFKIVLEEGQTKKPTFDCFGHILGLIVTRITDPIIAIRIMSVDCIESLLKVLIIYGENESLLVDQDKHFEQLSLTKQKIAKNDSNILLSAVSDLAKQLCKILPNVAQLISFTDKLIDGLLDIESHCSSASCIFLSTCVKLRGPELKEHVENMIRHLYAKLSLIQNNQAKLGTLRTIRIIFQQHLIESLNVILTFPIPCNKDFIDICQTLCEEGKLIQDILEHLLQIWNRCLPYEEKNNLKYASLTPLIGTCILSELFSNNTTANTEQVFNQNFEKIFTSLMMRVSSTLSNQMPIPKSKDDSNDVPATTNKKDKDDSKNSTKALIQAEYKKLDPCKISIDCFKNFIKCTQSFDLFEYYDNEKVWDLLGQESTNVEGCFVLARGLCLHGQKYIPNVISNFNAYLSAPYDCQKKSVTAFFAELINHQCILSHVEQLMNNLLSKLIDTHTPVRTLCIRGLGNISSLGKEEVQKHSTTILSAMMAGLDDKDDLNDDITLESMNGLTKIIALIDENNVRPILINILLRIRPCFEKDKGSIRASAYLLFGELARFGKGPSKDPYMEQIHSNFVSFILHLNETDDTVKRACKSVLRSVGPLIESSLINDLFQTTLIENKASFHYGEFINDMSKLLVMEFPEKISFYIMNSVSNFKSQWTEIRCNAVLFAGFMLGHLSKEKQSLLSKEHITNALIKLLREDPSPPVRQRAAESISLLSDF